MSSRLGFDELEKNVVSKGACIGCSACVASCPFKGVLDYAEGKPRLIGECKICGICSRVCPRYKVETGELDEMLFGRRRGADEVSGIYRSVQVARATEPQVRQRGQDGGVASAIILNALDTGAIEGAVLTGIDPNQPWRPLSTFAKTREEVLACAGTKYCYSPIFQGLKRALDQGLKRVALVGTPCQILAMRRMQKANLRKLVDPIVLSLGLFCSESFSYQGLMVEKIQNGLGVDLRTVAKMNIKGRMQVSLKNGKTLEIPLKEARAYAQSSCKFCEDFSSEFADISLGGVGLAGWTFTAARTERGQNFHDTAIKDGDLEVKPAKEFQSALDLLVRLSVSKRRNAQRILWQDV